MGLPRPHVEYRYSVYCSGCGKKWSPSVGAGFSHYAGTGNCPDCGTDYRVWTAFNRLFADEADMNSIQVTKND
jgi:hypothetical protein